MSLTRAPNFPCSQGANLEGVNLQGAWLREANLNYANLTNLHLGQLPFLSESSPVLSCAHSPASDQPYFAVGLKNHNISLYNTQNWKKRFTLIGHTQPVTGVAFSPDGEQLASCSEDCTVRLWDTSTGKCQFIFNHSPRRAPISNLTFSWDGQRLAFVYTNGIVELWDPRQGNYTQHLRTDPAYSEYAQPLSDEVNTAYPLARLAFSRDNEWLAVGGIGHTIQLWELRSGKCLKNLRQDTQTVVTHLSFVPNEQNHLLKEPAEKEIKAAKLLTGQLVSGSQEGAIQLWDLASGQCLRTLIVHHDAVTGFTFIPQPSTPPQTWPPASSSQDQTLRLWNLDQGECTQLLRVHTHRISGLACSPDGTQLASGSEDLTVRLWDLHTGKCLGMIQEFAGALTSINWRIAVTKLI